MSNTFASHSRELTNVLSSIRGILARPLSERDSGAIEKAKRLVDEGGSIINNLQSLLSNTSGSALKARQKKVDNFKKDLSSLTEEVQREHERLNRGELFASASNQQHQQQEPFDPFGDKLVSQMATLNDTTNMLNSTQQLVSDTEAIGSNVLSTLGSQREQLLNANKNVRETKSVTGQAKVLLRNMGRRAIYNKIFLYFVILALAAANGCIIWFQYLKPSKK
ncbi:hypothetical protein TrRE_jg9156 [Triparma retinervis]|uniref:t-SNARE coiled-coil homology domain-containing protein n=1 Tax=Triparma retinervis TaxID=2557542 RepID=A0A9W7E371_9STRA|nr:hypothetical protein TrRE_jg9156 [Triparma retinervis]